MSRKLTKRVLCNQTGITYDSVREASKELNVAPSGISQVANGNLKSTKGLTFSYVDEDNSEDELLVLRELELLKKENEELKSKNKELNNEILKPTFSEVEDKFSDKIKLTDDLISAIHLLREHSALSKDIQHLYNKQSQLDKLKTDLDHILEISDITTPKETNELLIKFRECLIERRTIKNLIGVYQALRKLDGFTTIDYSTICPSDKKVYKPRILDCGNLKNDSKIDLSTVFEKPKSIDEIDTEDCNKYIEHINNLPLTSTVSTKTIDFVSQNLSDLKQKLTQMRNSKMQYKSFRIVNGNKINCYL